MSRLLWIGWAVFVSVLLVMAVQMTCHVPRMDDWGLVIAPYFQWQDGGGFKRFGVLRFRDYLDRQMANKKMKLWDKK